MKVALGAAHQHLKVDGSYWGKADSLDLTVPPRDAVVVKLS